MLSAQPFAITAETRLVLRHTPGTRPGPEDGKCIVCLYRTPGFLKENSGNRDRRWTWSVRAEGMASRPALARGDATPPRGYGTCS